MQVYICNLLIVFFCSYYSRIISIKRSIEFKTNYCPSLFFTILAMSSMITIAGLRYGVGTDFSTYHELFTAFYKFDFNYIITGDLDDRGFIFFTWLIGRFTDEQQVAFFIYATIIILFVVFTIRDFGDPYELSMALYLTGLSYYSSFNGLRQWVASAVIFWAVRYLIKGDWKKYIFIVILISSFHLSALIMIPVYFLVRIKNWQYVSVILSLFFLGAFFAYSGFIGNLFSMLEGSQYGHYNSVLLNTSNGVNILRVLVWAVPFVAFILFNKQFNSSWPEGKYIFRLSFIGFLFAVLAIKNASIFRICMYFDIYNILIVPRIATFFEYKTNLFIYYCIFICYFLYSYLVIPFDSNLLPYDFYNIFE